MLSYGMMAIIHGGWGTIALALLFWAFVFLCPPAVVIALVWWLLKHKSKRPNPKTPLDSN